MIDKKLLEKWDKEYFWHPFTQMKVYAEEDNVIVERGEGNYIYDIYGNKYLDGVASLWCNVHGHNHPKLNKAIIDQLNKIAHFTTLGASNIPAILLAKKLVEITPSKLEKVFYSEDGSEAMEIAIKIAYHYWHNIGEKEKTKFVTLNEAYHGDTLGSVSVGGINIFHEKYKPLLFDVYKLPSPYLKAIQIAGREKALEEETTKKLIEEVEEFIFQNHQRIAGFVVEGGVQGAAGILPFPKGYLKEIRRICTEYNILLIVDEVAVGFGRTGYMFASEKEGIEPDILALGKGITGGYLPLAATLTTKEIFDAFWGEFGEAKHFYHGHTYTGNPLACNVALANIELFDEEKRLKNVKERIKQLESRLPEFLQLKYVGDVRNYGLMAGVELVKDKKTKEPFPYGERTGFKVAKNMLKRGIWVRPLGDVMVIMPPLSITAEELDYFIDSLKDSINEI
ncbi:adenosylmethionine--8-amino-7-oxononanoate transaminase [Venenivibrio stagnispumantis]|uniref:Adenosylmethionine-8-amino-7-oxononanoate aminotransferase n=1 Tax=Venenivibrio stagnispumantis TaxID=407998 RepID=A0AA46AF09_9AQUI|nr:adenosylmethionine--8-amino-7-oxononanoate transaminase [Venenivibrio stagnispumantis]MCW4573566.1 adenosylmethionine--8-amino-7-oxononanoate transaminase [Venenivibrio stagnispumantis]SMP16314.1 adenosylmethionine-8-amino-7-oxononanoate aminotransferase [Venenivibrio stagnispumantis]